MKTNQLQKNIPNGWQQVKLGDIGNSYSGITGKNKEDFGFGKPFISYMNIYLNPQINPNIYNLVNIKDEDNQNQVKYGDIFFTTSSETPDEVGISSVLLEKNIGKVYLNSFCFGFRLHNFKIITPEYAKHFFRAKPFRGKMATIAQGATRFNLSKKYFNEVTLDIPIINEQNRIVSVLETWDKVIENLNKKIEIKKQIKKGLMQDLLTGKKRLSGFKDKWEVKKLGDICNKENSDVSSNTLDFNNGNYPIYGASGFIKNIDFYRQNKSYISIIKDGAGVGRLTLHKAQTSVLGTLNILHENTNSDLMFLYFLLQIIDFKKYMVGSTIPHIYFKDYKKEKIIIPNIKEQNAIANILITAEKEIIELERKLSITKNQKKYLLNNLITGRIRTPENLSINK